MEDLLLSVEWKTEACISGEDCWCRVIVPKDKLTDDDGDELYVVSSGALPREYAEHIVRLHNQSLKKT